MKKFRFINLFALIFVKAYFQRGVKGQLGDWVCGTGCLSDGDCKEGGQCSDSISFIMWCGKCHYEDRIGNSTLPVGPDSNELSTASGPMDQTTTPTNSLNTTTKRSQPPPGFFPPSGNAVQQYADYFNGSGAPLVYLVQMFNFDQSSSPNGTASSKKNQSKMSFQGRQDDVSQWLNGNFETIKRFFSGIYRFAKRSDDRLPIDSENSL